MLRYHIFEKHVIFNVFVLFETNCKIINYFIVNAWVYNLTAGIKKIIVFEL